MTSSIISAGADAFRHLVSADMEKSLQRLRNALTSDNGAGCDGIVVSLNAGAKEFWPRRPPGSWHAVAMGGEAGISSLSLDAAGGPLNLAAGTSLDEELVAPASRVWRSDAAVDDAATGFSSTGGPILPQYIPSSMRSPVCAAGSERPHATALELRHVPDRPPATPLPTAPFFKDD